MGPILLYGCKQDTNFTNFEERQRLTKSAVLGPKIINVIQFQGSLPYGR
jgi:hypothetical protein